MKLLTGVITFLVLAVSLSAQAADMQRRQARVVYQQPQPAIREVVLIPPQVPVVATVVNGSLGLAGALIAAPFELVEPRR